MERSASLGPLKKALHGRRGLGVDRTRQSQIKYRRDKRSTTGVWTDVVLLPLGESWDEGLFPGLGDTLTCDIRRPQQRLDKIQATRGVNRDPLDPVSF